jgi:hypothetical protein
MTAGLTDHIWSTTELFSYRVPAAFLDRLSDLEPSFPSFNLIHQGNSGTLPSFLPAEQIEEGIARIGTAMRAL